MFMVGCSGSWPASCETSGRDMQPQSDKPSWVEALEESLLLAISLFALITWIVTISVLGH